MKHIWQPNLLALLFSALFSTSLIGCDRVFAQTSTEIHSSRPGAAIGANVVGTKFFQIESGVQRLKDSGENEVLQDTWVTEFRYGLSEKLELTSEFDLETDQSPHEPEVSGISDVELGLKYSLLSGSEGLLPVMSARLRIKIPGGQGSFFQRNPTPNLILASSWDLTDSTALEADLGFSSNTDDGSSDPFFAINLETDLSEKLSGFIECFHSFEDESGNVEFDAGVGYLITRNLQLDASAGWGRHDHTTETLVSAGLSWRTSIGN